ncbi:MAG TPA: EAL domain-containing protein [Burkholderiales bacterium]|nr:EAL domain-containing protein [Burkholderiales bacterium]
MVGSYSGGLVALSVIVATLASYVALELASRVSGSGSRTARYWLAAGACSMGISIWSMHFIGMLAFRLPIRMSYDVAITLLSLLIAILVSGFALFTVSRGTLSWRRLGASGVLMGSGIAAMHYTGMAAMAIQPGIRYQPGIFALSVGIAIAASMAALWIAFNLRTDDRVSGLVRRLGAACVMGAAISGMHYTGMAAAQFAPDSICTVPPVDLDNLWLAGAVAVFAVALGAATLVIVLFDERLHRGRERLELVARATNDAVRDWDLLKDRLWWNDGYAALFGYSAKDTKPGVESWSDFIHPEDRGRVLKGVHKVIDSGGTTWNDEYRFRRRDGSDAHILDRGFVVRDADGRAVRMIGAMMDISGRKHAEAELAQLAQYDTLTGLPNRNLLRDRLAQAVARVHREGWLSAVLFVDLDRFKEINDTLGHATGDEVLKMMAARMRTVLRQADTVARFGGDEFTILVEDVKTPSDVAGVARKILGVLELPMAVEGRDLFLSASIGIAVCPDDGKDSQTLLQHADTAMYQAKAAGRNGFEFYAARMGAAASERMTIEASLRQALERNEFVLHYQSIVDVKTGALRGAEALVRWQHPQWGLVAPARFIGIAEASGLIVPLGEWIMQEACRQAVQWRAAGLPPLRMSVNLSARQFRKPALAEVIAATLARAGLPGDSLTVEITESLLMENAQGSRKMLAELKTAHGVRVALDDFGTGYSSLSYLKQFPLDVLKIDRSFVRDVTTDSDDAAIVRAMIGLAHNLDLTLTAEGVETPEQLAFLREHGCDTAQGYLFSKPIPADAFAALYTEKTDDYRLLRRAP